MVKTYRADLHVHTRFMEEDFNINSKRSKILNLFRRDWKTLLKGVFVKRSVYKKLKPKSDVAILDALNIPESSLDPEEAVKCALKNNMTFVPITNHNDVDAAIYLSKKFPGKVLIGEEVSVTIDKKRIMHVLVYFLNYSLGELRYSAKDFEKIKRVHDKIQEYRENLDALAVFLKAENHIFISCAHPFSKTAFSRFIFTKGNQIDEHIIKIISENFDFIEVFNGSYSELENFLAREFALKHGLGFSAGSDVHETINELDSGILSMPGSTYLEAEAKNLEDFFQKMKRRRVKIVGTKYKLDKIKRLLTQKYYIHWTHITNPLDRAFMPLIHLVFFYAVTSHYFGYRKKLKNLALKMNISYSKFLTQEFDGVVEVRKLRKI